MKILATLEGERIMLFPNGHIMFYAKAAIDADGSGGNPENDPYFQPDTSYHFQGKALNAYTTNFIVVPPIVITSVEPIVLGCHARVRNMKNGRKAVALVGDVGPKTKIGEISVALALELDIPCSPVDGGMEEHDVFYELFPGMPAYCNGQSWPLQPYG